MAVSVGSTGWAGLALGMIVVAVAAPTGCADDSDRRGLRDLRREAMASDEESFDLVEVVVPEGAPCQVGLPRRADRPFVVADVASGSTIEVTLEGAAPVTAEVAGNEARYRRAYAGEADVVHRITPRGTEDFILFETPPATTEVAYDVALGEGVAGLRLVNDQLELIDAGGAPRLRVAPPRLLDGRGGWHDARLAVEGCAVDRDPAPPWGREPTPPGAVRCRLVVDWTDEGLVYPVAMDPFWSTTSSLAEARFVHTAERLVDGRVLVVGGEGLQGVLASAELFDPATQTWAAAGALATARLGHTSSRLADGRVLVVGGRDPEQELSSVEIYEPATGAWSGAADLAAARYDHSADVLGDGKVLVVGGVDQTQLATAEVYDPDADAWSPTGSLAAARQGHESVQLADGSILVVGGIGPSPLASAERFDPTTETWDTTPNMIAARTQHTATLLDDGRVLVVGGYDGGDLVSAELYDPVASSWTETASTTWAWRQTTATRLADGSVLLAGGWTDAELYDPVGGQWSVVGNLSSPRRYHTATRLDDGRVLAVGGRGGGRIPLADVDIFSPLADLGEACDEDGQCASGHCVDEVCCADACGDGQADDCLVCDSAMSPGACMPLPEGTACGEQGLACQIDDVCDDAGTCVDGGAVPDGTACDEGACQSGDCVSPDAGGGGSVGAGAGSPGGSSPTSSESSSGGCRFASPRAASGTRALLLVALALALRRRRRSSRSDPSDPVDT